MGTTLNELPLRSRPSRKITERSYSATTLIQVHNENGSVMTNSNAANIVSTKAQNPGPSGSAETKKNQKISISLGVGGLDQVLGGQSFLFHENYIYIYTYMNSSTTYEYFTITIS